MRDPDNIEPTNALELQQTSDSKASASSKIDDTPTGTENYVKTEDRKKFLDLPILTRPDAINKPDTSESWMACIKFSLIVCNLFIWLFGAAITGISIWILMDTEFSDIQKGISVDDFTKAIYVFLSVGVFLLIIGFIGCFSVYKKASVLFLIYTVIVIVLVVMEFAVIGIIWSNISQENKREEVKLRIRTAIGLRNENEAFNRLLDLLQSKLQCCGFKNYTDYSDSQQPIPHSCTSTSTGLPYEIGCFDAVLSFLKSKGALIGGIVAVIFIFQIGAIVCSICLHCGLKQGKKSVF